MTSRPILFSAPMVRALLNGSKTQTRRICKLDVRAGMPEPEVASLLKCCPYGQPGDELLVRESFIHEPADYCWEASVSIPCRPAVTVYRADADDPRGGRWTPSIHMPRGLSRITLRINEVRVERLQDISEADALAEGSREWAAEQDTPVRDIPAGETRLIYRQLWESINGPNSWDANPWLWVLSFERVK